MRRVIASLTAVVTLGLVVGASAAWAAPGDIDLVSRANGFDGARGRYDSRGPSISGDGRYVVFESQADDLSPDDVDTIRDVYLRDVRTGKTVLVSRATGVDGAKADADSLQPAVSDDGRYVAFTSYATNLDPDVTSGQGIFVRDLWTATTTLVSRTPAGARSLILSPSEPSLSDDGRFVAFEATDFNRFTGTSSGQVYRADWRTAFAAPVSRSSGANGALADGRGATDPAISGDGRVVAFRSAAANLGFPSADPRPPYRVYVRDVAAATTTLVSRATGAAGAKVLDGAGELDISGDGSAVAFSAIADELDPLDHDDVPDVFVRDLDAQTTTLASRVGTDGPKGDARSGGGALSDDGAYLAFGSEAANLVPGDPDGAPNVLRKQLEPVAFEGFDAHGPAKAGSTFVSRPLAAGEAYTVTVRGTASAFARTLMERTTRGWTLCGRTEAAPLFPSPGVANGATGLDAEYTYAFPQPGTRCNPRNVKLPARQPAVRFSQGGGAFTTPQPTEPLSGPSPDHTYTYRVVGDGGPLTVKMQDVNYADDCGRFEVTVDVDPLGRA